MLHASTLQKDARRTSCLFVSSCRSHCSISGIGSKPPFFLLFAPGWAGIKNATATHDSYLPGVAVPRLLACRLGRSWGARHTAGSLSWRMRCNVTGMVQPHGMCRTGNDPQNWANLAETAGKDVTAGSPILQEEGYQPDPCLNCCSPELRMPSGPLRTVEQSKGPRNRQAAEVPSQCDRWTTDNICVGEMGGREG